MQARGPQPQEAGGWTTSGGKGSSAGDERDQTRSDLPQHNTGSVVGRLPQGSPKNSHTLAWKTLPPPPPPRVYLSPSSHSDYSPGWSSGIASTLVPQGLCTGHSFPPNGTLSSHIQVHSVTPFRSLLKWCNLSEASPNHLNSYDTESFYPLTSLYTPHPTPCLFPCSRFLTRG